MRGAGIIRFFVEELPKLFRPTLSTSSLENSWVFVTTPTEDFTWWPQGYFLNRITDSLRQTIRRKSRNQSFKTRMGYFAASLLALPMAYFFLFKIIGMPSNLENTSFPYVTESEQRILQEKIEKKYLFLVSDGDQWLENGSYYNAIFQYKKAFEILPTNDAKYKLAFAYSERCIEHHVSCDKAKELSDSLYERFPSDAEIRMLYQRMKGY